MIWILLLYVLPLVLSAIGGYIFHKKDGGTVKDFLLILPWLFIPLLNIAAVVGGIIVVIREWLENSENWQNFLNKKL
jgi:hypothetical protein